MLVLKRKPGEGLLLNTANGPIVIYPEAVGGGVKVHIDAPETVSVMRNELTGLPDHKGYMQAQAAKRKAAQAAG